jgi:hypothetical protein
MTIATDTKSDRDSIVALMEKRAEWAEKAVEYLDEAGTCEDRVSKKWLTNKAAVAAMASGVAHFQASVAAGHCPNEHPYDGAMSIRAALDAAGLKIVKAR